MADLVGQLVGGKYRVAGRLGGGGVSEVFEAVHEEIGQHFALKVLKREYANYPDVVKRFFLEARAASAAGHPGIVQVFDIGRLDDGTPYLMMELLQGESLSDVLQRRKKLPLDQAVGVCLHILDALAAAHRAGVIHRDLKPENVVLVRGPGGEPWAKLIDFGIARLAREGPAALRQTGQGAVMGTPYYMSPEQARGSADIDARSDIYAVGVMLFEMIAGKLPFEGQSSEEILTKVLSQPFPSLRALEPSIPPALEYVVQTATQRKRDDRYGTAIEFADALRPLRAEMVAVQMLSPDEEAALLGDPDPSSIRRLSELAERVPEAALAGRRSTPPRLTPARMPAVRGATPPRSTPRPDIPPGVPLPPTQRTGRFPAAQPRITPRPSHPPAGSEAALVRQSGGHPMLTPMHVSSRPSQPPGDEPSQSGRRMTPAGGRRASHPSLPPASIPPGHTALIVSRRTLFLLLVIGTALVAASVAALLIALAGRGDEPRPPPNLGVETQGARVAILPSSDDASDPTPPAADAGTADATTTPGGTADAGTPATTTPDAGPELADPADTTDASDASPPDSAPAPLGTLRLRGVPRGARATIDDLAVEREFELPLDGVQRLLRVAAPGYKTFELPFVPRDGLVLQVRMVRGRNAEDGGTAAAADGGTGAATQDAGTAPATDARAPLANPFGNP
jgi:serine/threonine-protein kinase